MKLAEAEVLPDARHAARSEGADPEADPLHHRQRGLRALQLLRDAQHPHRVPGHLAAALSAGGGARRGAKDVFHTFVIGVYFFPLLGGWLADRFFGKYNTSSGSAWSIASARLASRCLSRTAPASTSGSA